MNITLTTMINSFNIIHFGHIPFSRIERDEIDAHIKNVTEQYVLMIDNKQNDFIEVVHKAFDYFENKEPEKEIYFVRTITQNKVELRYSVVPRFKGFVDKYCDFIGKIRSYKNIEDAIKDYYNDEFNNKSSALAVLKFSKELGNKGSNAYRTQDYVHSKMSEELGEHSVELQIQKGLSYKEPGKDLLHGEAVDLAICCLDSFALEFPELSAEEIYEKFNEYMLIKLNKWKGQK